MVQPVKYMQVIYTVAAYSVMEPVLSAVFESFGDIDAMQLVQDLGLDFSEAANDILSRDVFPAIPSLFENMAELLGGKLKDGATDFDWPKDMDLKVNPLLQKPNIYPILWAYLLSPRAAEALGFNLGKISTSKIYIKIHISK